jgi:thiamine biosynthesis lipoprotein
MIEVVRSFGAMGSDCTLRITAANPDLADDLASRAEALVRQLESLWTRFRSDSELMVLNDNAGGAWGVSPDTFALIGAAMDAHRITNGIFDPTLLDALIAAGYDRSFEQLGSGVIASKPLGLEASPVKAVELDAERNFVTLPAGVHLDLGGIAKGRAADLVARLLESVGAAGACVDLGGDIAVFGDRIDDQRWAVAVDDPAQPGTDLAVLVLERGAVATSSRAKRQWQTSVGSAHHLLDPRTGRSAVSDLVAVTVVAAEAMWAEVFAKAALIAGSTEGATLLEGVGLSALLITESGERRSVGALDAFLVQTSMRHS